MKCFVALISLAAFLLAISSKTASAGEIRESLTCTFDTYKWSFMPQAIYYCDVQNKRIFDEDRVTIDAVVDTHAANKTDGDVAGFVLYHATNLDRFPRGLENFFRNLIFIFVSSSKLRELTADVLRGFPRLRFLQLPSNSLQLLHADLFAHSPQLEVVDLSYNKIAHIDPFAFDGLRNLRILDLGNNVCKGMQRVDTREKVVLLLKRVRKGECTLDKYRTTTTTSENPLTVELRTKTALIEELQRQLTEERAKNANLSASNAELRAVNANLSEDLSHKEHLVAAFSGQNQQLLVENRGLELKLNRTEAKVEENLATIRNQSAQMAAKMAEIGGDCRATNASLAGMERSNRELKDTILAVLIENEKSQARLAERFSNFTVLTGKLEEREERLRETGVELRSCRDEIRKIESEKETWKEETLKAMKELAAASQGNGKCHR